MPGTSGNPVIVRARHYGTAELLDIHWRRGLIVALENAKLETPPDFQAGWVAPALFDLQINGCLGHSFNSPELAENEIREVARVCADHGISSFCPTLVTNSFEALHHGLTTIRRACEADPRLAHTLPAIHLEGPWLSPEDGPRGAHPREHIRPPNWEEFRRLQDAAGGKIRLVTLAPEHEGALEIIEQLVKSEVMVALGHTAAASPRIRDAIKAGAKLSMHLGNGSHAVLPRHDNYFWEQLAADELWASIICDGFHLPRNLVRCILRVKTPKRMVLTCDAGSLAGLPPGRYREWGQDLEVVPEGKIVIPGTSYLAGSWAFTDACISWLTATGEVGLRDAIDMATLQPRALLGLPLPRLDAGCRTDLMLFDWSPKTGMKVAKTLIEPGSAFPV
jgi:N-acetylglucosamine-6-phosphate deacetylase